MMSLWDALRMNMMISYQELVRTFLNSLLNFVGLVKQCFTKGDRNDVTEWTPEK